MTGVLLETLSNKKILSLVIIFILLQLVFFLLGGLIGTYYTSFSDSVVIFYNRLKVT